MPTVFFSWQRDTSTTEGRNFLERTLERAIAIVASDLQLEEAVREGLELDRDTLGVAGQPSIVETIFRKIDAAAVFVPDLTFVGTRSDGRPTPNPNVLIEYGYALHCLSNSRIVAVMNSAHGPPGDNMPFDMRHLRWPLTYHLPDGADEATRRTERDKLARLLADAIRAVLDSAEYRDALPSAPVPAHFVAAVASNGPARFRGPGEPLGVTSPGPHSSAAAVDKHLEDGPAIWLRVMPETVSGKVWSLTELKRAATASDLHLLPLRRGYGGYDYLRAADGVGVFVASNRAEKTCGVVFVFTTGEVWSIDSCLISDCRQRGDERRGLPTMEEEFKTALGQYDRFLRSIGLTRPFRWVGGYEGIRGMGLYYPPPPGKKFLLPGPRGASAADVVESEGVLGEGMSVAQALKPLFTKLFDACDIVREDYLDDMNNPP